MPNLSIEFSVQLSEEQFSLPCFSLSLLFKFNEVRTMDPRLILKLNCDLLLAFQQLDFLQFYSTKLSFEFLQLHHFVKVAMLVNFFIFVLTNSLELNGFFGCSIIELFL